MWRPEISFRHLCSETIHLPFLSQRLSLGPRDCQLDLASWPLSPGDPPASTSLGFVLQMILSITTTSGLSGGGSEANSGLKLVQEKLTARHLRRFSHVNV